MKRVILYSNENASIRLQASGKKLSIIDKADKVLSEIDFFKYKDSAIYSVSDDGSFLAVADTKNINVYRVADGENVICNKVYRGYSTRSFHFMSNETLFVLLQSKKIMGTKLVFLNAATGEEKIIFKSGEEAISCSNYIDDKFFLVTDKYIRYYNIDGEELFSISRKNKLIKKIFDYEVIPVRNYEIACFEYTFPSSKFNVTIFDLKENTRVRLKKVSRHKSLDLSNVGNIIWNIVEEEYLK